MFSIVESSRYGFYFLKGRNLDSTKIGRLFGLLRYNTFTICYPVGACCDCLVGFYSAKFLSGVDDYSVRMPNSWNFAFDMSYFLYALVPLYGATFP
jgi:Protein tyrosine phosphatase-like protein, PTPLA